MERARIEKLVPGGQGIATLGDGKRAFVWGALPGELVEFRVTRSKRSYCEGTADTVLEAAAQRIEARDECYLATSPWQVFDYAYELEQKAHLVEECFRQQHVAITDSMARVDVLDTQMNDMPQVATTRPADAPAPHDTQIGDMPRVATAIPPIRTDGKDFHYRNKMEYSPYWDNAENLIKLAFHARGSHRKVPITASSIERPEILARARAMIAELNASKAEARAFQALLARCDRNGRVEAALFENGKPHPRMGALFDTLLGHRYSYSPNGFFQINLPMYEMVLEEIRRQIETNKVLDLYAGVGTIGLSVARERELTLVEVDESAYTELERNAAETGARTILARSENVLEYITSDTTVIVDPPRAGCDAGLLEKLNEVVVPKIVYLSCNPITQARDVAALLGKYSIALLQGYNFFPRTPHVENLVVLVAKVRIK